MNSNKRFWGAVQKGDPEKGRSSTYKFPQGGLDLHNLTRLGLACLLALAAQNTATVVKTSPGAADGSKWPLEPAPEPQLPRNGRSSLPLSRRMLEKCCSSLARSRKMLEKWCSSLPRSRRMIEKCCSSLRRKHRWLEMAAQACP